MSLSEIKNKLYRKDMLENLSRHDTSKYDPRSKTAKIDPEKSEGSDAWIPEEKELNTFQKRAISKGILAFGVIIAIIAAAAVWYVVKKGSFTETGASVFITGPNQVRSGKLLTYEINYKNDNRVDINNAVLRIYYPEDFKPEDNSKFSEEGPNILKVDLGTVKSRDTGKIILNGKVFSPKGVLMYLRTNLRYQPAKFSSQFETGSQLGINVIPTPMRLEIQAPQNVSSGDEVNYLVTYRNDGDEAFNDLKIKIDYPEQFTFSDSSPKVSEGDNIWYIGELAPGREGKIFVSGKLLGEHDQIKTVKVYVGAINKDEFVSYNEESTNTKIVGSPLAITQTVNGLTDLNANVGDRLEFEINYKNNGNIGLKDVIITEKLNSSVLDYSTLNLKGGSFNTDTKTITWKASDIKDLKNLESGQDGTIIFSVKIKDIIPIANANDKNFVISSVAKIDSPDVPTLVPMNKIISGNKMDIKLNSKLVLDVKGYYTDLSIPNSGPIPPKVGEETTYTMHWSMINISNDIADAKVKATLPTNTTMTGVIFPDGARIDYNERNNSIIWDIGNVMAGSGILSIPQEASFQIKIKPSPDQVNREVKLLGESKITARDLFTGENLEKTAGDKSTNLIEDKTIVGADGGRVTE